MRIIFLILTTAIITACSTRMKESNDQAIIEHDTLKAIGIWQVPRNERTVYGETNDTKWVTGPNPDRFAYDGTYVTLMLVTMKGWMWKTPDDLYKVRSKWSNDTLFYLPPFGRWESLATFKNDAFHYSYEINDSIYSWTYKKITAKEMDSGYTDLIKQRKPHDYSIKPLDTYKE